MKMQIAKEGGEEEKRVGLGKKALLIGWVVVGGGFCGCGCECEFLVRCGRKRAKKEEKEREGGRTREKGKSGWAKKRLRPEGCGERARATEPSRSGGEDESRSSVGLGWNRAAGPLKEATDTVSQCTVLDSDVVMAAQRIGNSALDSALARPVGRSNWW